MTVVLPVGMGCSKPRSRWGRRWRRHATGQPCPAAGHQRVGNKPLECSHCRPVTLQLQLSGRRQHNKKWNITELCNDMISISYISVKVHNTNSYLSGYGGSGLNTRKERDILLQWFNSTVCHFIDVSCSRIIILVLIIWNIYQTISKLKLNHDQQCN